MLVEVHSSNNFYYWLINVNIINDSFVVRTYCKTRSCIQNVKPLLLQFFKIKLSVP